MIFDVSRVVQKTLTDARALEARAKRQAVEAKTFILKSVQMCRCVNVCDQVNGSAYRFAVCRVFAIDQQDSEDEGFVLIYLECITECANK